ncbi:LytTR family DNA-binding domain-containing protein [Sedimentibacter sp.]|uniref:LytR/AlgR family response regulator transcription factor n=1 Tax=Sedimentibacter sp. TaxID=1960295 RepID=UPI002898EF71|nr:LytTR family DNA-binding domain-containing protein [Sedimentibacter sp.]
MKNKIALYGDAEKLNQAEDVLSEYMNENDIPFEIHRISDSEQFLREFLLRDDYMLFMVSEKGTLRYLLKIYKNFDRQTVRYAYGKLKLPLTQKELKKHMHEAVKSTHTCPYGIYAAKNAKMSRLIQHSDIECIYKEKNKSVFYLSSGETMEVTNSLSGILTELDANYFIKCSKGYIVNFFNIEQVSDDYKTLTMKSGVEIPMSRIGQKEFFRSLSLSITGVNAFNY